MYRKSKNLFWTVVAAAFCFTAPLFAGVYTFTIENQAGPASWWVFVDAGDPSAVKEIPFEGHASFTVESEQDTMRIDFSNTPDWSGEPGTDQLWGVVPLGHGAVYSFDWDDIYVLESGVWPVDDGGTETGGGGSGEDYSGYVLGLLVGWFCLWSMVEAWKMGGSK